MKIRDLKAYPVWIGQRNQLLLKIETDEGIFGWGEAGLSGRELAVVGAIEHYKDFLIGKNPLSIGAIWQELYRSQYFEGGRVLTAAISAIDIALYDILGKALDVPVYQLLGGKQRDYVPCFATAASSDREKLLEDIAMLLELGWQAIRIGPVFDNQGDQHLFEPRESIGVTARWVNKIRDVHGFDFSLGIDYHHRLTSAETASFCQRLMPGALDFLEEPIRAENPDAYRALRKMTPIPFAIGEEFSSKWAFLPFLEQGLTDFARLDICNVGGFTEALKVASLAESHYIDLMPHNPLGPICTAASLHLAAAIPNFAWLETREAPSEKGLFHDDEIFPDRPQLEGSRYPVSDKVGLGIEVNEAALQNKKLKLWEAPHLRKRDGSYTNW